MASDLVNYLARERIAELEAQHASQLEEERANLEAARVALIAAIREVREPARLLALHHDLLRAPDQASAERLLKAGQ